MANFFYRKKVNDLGLKKGENIKKLLIKIQKGDVVSFEKLYHIYKIQIFNFCYSTIKSKNDTEEIVQDVFLQIWKSRHQFDEIISFNGFIYRIAKNKTINKIRRRVGEPVTFDSMKDNFLVLNQTENEIMFREMEEMLDVAIEALPRKRQEIFRLSREEGFSNEEIAQRLGISINTVKSQMTKALTFLKNYIE